MLTGVVVACVRYLLWSIVVLVLWLLFVVVCLMSFFGCALRVLLNVVWFCGCCCSSLLFIVFVVLLFVRCAWCVAVWCCRALSLLFITLSCCMLCVACCLLVVVVRRCVYLCLFVAVVLGLS